MLCKYCGKSESVIGLTYCSECKLKFKKYNTDRKDRLVSAGICIVCGSSPSADGVKTCPKCRARVNSREASRKSKLRASGICPRCEKNRISHGYACEDCKPSIRKSARESQRRRIVERGALGLCSDCKIPVDNPSGMGRCLECHCKQLSKLNHLAGSNWMDLVEIWNYQHGRCALSGLNMLLNDSEVDHIVPVSSGGLNDKSNLRWVTKKAN